MVIIANKPSRVCNSLFAHVPHSCPGGTRRLGTPFTVANPRVVPRAQTKRKELTRNLETPNFFAVEPPKRTQTLNPKP